MCTEINSAMGLQATSATKRKHELTFDNKDGNTTYTNCPPPIKTNKWSINNNNYIDSLEEQLYINKIDNSKTIKESSNKNSLKNRIPPCEAKIGKDRSESTNCDNNKASTTASSVLSIHMPQSKTAVKTLVSKLITGASEMAASKPLSPTSTTPIPEDSIAKLEVVAAVPCEPWMVNNSEQIDCISKLQAVAVPSDPWGSITTRSTLATTLLSTEEIDDDEDDFEEDYEEEESIIPTYCPLRYHSFSPTHNSHQQQRVSNYGYASRPNFYSEPFPQQNCSKTVSSQNLRVGNANGFLPQWQTNSAQQFYENGAYPPQQQQTIRCAENGKSYLDLGCSSPMSTTTNSSNSATATATAQPAFVNISPHLHSGNVEVRHNLKRCCDGRANWCNTSKTCYKDLRLKIRNLSMFKLSRFRQVTEQSLYRSVLICNTLKRIDREIETENKEMQHVAQHHQQQVTQYQQQNTAHHHYLQTQSPALVPSQPIHHALQSDYNPVLNCTRLSNAEYQQSQQVFQQTLQYHNQTERLDPPLSYQLQKPSANANYLSHQNNNTNCDSTTTSNTTLHPYDHYPFRESQSGRATPFPTCQTVITSNVASSLTSTTSATNSSSPQYSNINTCETSDSGYTDDDSTRSINWSSVLSLSQSALDPLNNNDLFAILPPTNSITNALPAIPTVSTSVSVVQSGSSTPSVATSISGTVAINGSFTTVQSNIPSSSSNSVSSNSTSTTATFTTLSTISAASHSLTSSYINCPPAASTWEYSFLEMEFGLGSEFTELAPNCKHSSEELFKKRESDTTTMPRFSSVHMLENEQQPAHIMVGS